MRVFSRIFLDEGAPVVPPGFNSPPAWQIGGGGIQTFPITGVTVVAYVGNIGTTIANSDHAGRRRLISFPTQTNVRRVVVTITSSIAPDVIAVADVEPHNRTRWGRESWARPSSKRPCASYSIG